jgi:hypothetical protein
MRLNAVGLGKTHFEPRKLMGSIQLFCSVLALPRKHIIGFGARKYSLGYASAFIAGLLFGFKVQGREKASLK